MLHKLITYKDFEDNEHTEEYWFHIGRDEVLKKSLVDESGDYLARLSALQTSRNGKEIMAHFEDILGDAVGKREGQLLVKTEEIRKQFLYSGAYGQFLFELLQTEDSGASWIAAILPKDAQGAVRDEMKKQGMNVPGEESRETTVELPSSGVIEGVLQDKPVLQKAVEGMNMAETVTPPPTATPATPANIQAPEKDPLWVQEMRNPTRSEMIGMSKEDLQLLFKMREAGVLE